MLLDLIGILGICYLKVVENDPFPIAVRVRLSDGEQIQLDDGRIISDFGGLSSEDRERINDSVGRLGFELNSGIASLYTRYARTICLTGRPMFTIPLVPIEVPRYERKLLVIGRISNQ